MLKLILIWFILKNIYFEFNSSSVPLKKIYIYELCLIDFKTIYLELCTERPEKRLYGIFQNCFWIIRLVVYLVFYGQNSPKSPPKIGKKLCFLHLSAIYMFGISLELQEKWKKNIKNQRVSYLNPRGWKIKNMIFSLFFFCVFGVEMENLSINPIFF